MSPIFITPNGHPNLLCILHSCRIVEMGTITCPNIPRWFHKSIKGDQSLATELRVRASMELVQNREYYEKFHLGDRLHLVSDKYDVAVRDCITNYAFSSAWTVHACASVISRSIKSVYPPVNGILDPSVSVLNAVFPPRALKSRHTVTLMWSSCSLSKPSGNWYPDHFVPLLPNDTNSTVIDLSSNVDFPPLSKSRPSQSPPAKSPTSFQASPVSSPAKSPPAPSFQASPVSSPAKSPPAPSFQTSPVSSPAKSSESSSDNPLDFPYSNPPTHSLHGKFLDNGDVLELVLERGDREVFSGGVPEGIKENVFFVVDCGDLNGKSKFVDDCGVWQSKKNSTKTVDFLLTNSGSLEVLYKKNQLLCKFVKKQYIPLSPQPSSSEIVRMKRYYSVSATNSNFKRRVSWFENIPGILWHR